MSIAYHLDHFKANHTTFDRRFMDLTQVGPHR